MAVPYGYVDLGTYNGKRVAIPQALWDRFKRDNPGDERRGPQAFADDDDNYYHNDSMTVSLSPVVPVSGSPLTSSGRSSNPDQDGGWTPTATPTPINTSVGLLTQPGPSTATITGLTGSEAQALAGPTLAYSNPNPPTSAASALSSFSPLAWVAIAIGAFLIFGKGTR